MIKLHILSTVVIPKERSIDVAKSIERCVKGAILPYPQTDLVIFDATSILHRIDQDSYHQK